MLLFVATHPGDQELLLRNVRWWNQLGSCKNHSVLFCSDPRCDQDTIKSIDLELRKCFGLTEHRQAGAAIDNWPQGANYFFRLCAGWLQNTPGCRYWFWMEPDAVPLREGWLDDIEAEFLKAGKPFMGDRVEAKIEGKEVPLHMSGVGVYPNPLYEFAGEAYRAHDEAWDMAGREQIVRQAHFTKLICHAWKHPTFTNLDELETQIRPEAVLFHSSKDGSLITLLQQQRGRNDVIIESRSIDSIPQPKESRCDRDSPSPTPTCDIFIRTYAGDYDWLQFCLKGISKFASGFRKVWIVSPAREPMWISDFNTIPAEYKQINDETQDGYLAQQITKLYADVITDYQADYILHVDSDVILTRPVTPRDFFQADLPVWLYTPYSKIQTPWQPITEKFMSDEVPNEYMRRFPIMVPRWLYAKLREFCYHRHAATIADYIKRQPLRSFSEFNALGAYADRFHRDKFMWINTFETELPEPFARQFHSWSGLTPEVKKELEAIFKGGDAPCVDTKSIHPVISNGAETVQPSSAPEIPQGIKVLPGNIWVLEGDQISGWVEQEGRLDHDRNLLPSILPYIKEGDVVVDAGAFIGDHSIAYLKAVGKKGVVVAFEPNPLAMACLKHNLNGTDHKLATYQVALGDRHEQRNLSGNNGNYGGVYLGEHMPIASVNVEPLDDYKIAPNFIKWDVEGSEVKALLGAAKTIKRYQPKMVIEVNEVALQRQGDSPEGIFDLLKEWNYGWQILQENCTLESPLYDIVALPAEPRGIAPLPGSIAPPASLTPYQEMVQHIKALVAYCGHNGFAKMRVIRQLQLHKIIKKKKR